MRKGAPLVTPDRSSVLKRADCGPCPHGRVAALLGTARSPGLEKLLDRRPLRMRSLALAMTAGRVLDPRSKLAVARGLESDSLGVGLR